MGASTSRCGSGWTSTPSLRWCSTWTSSTSSCTFCSCSATGGTEREVAFESVRGWVLSLSYFRVNAEERETQTHERPTVAVSELFKHQYYDSRFCSKLHVSGCAPREHRGTTIHMSVALVLSRPRAMIAQ